MSRLIIAVIIAAVLALGAWITIDKGNESDQMNMTKNASTNQQQQKEQPVTTNKVSIQNYTFTPADITVKKGTTVTWTNDDTVAHTVTQDDTQPAGSPGLDSKGFAPGETYKATFNQTGTYHYHCSLHAQMTGTVTVTE